MFFFTSILLIVSLVFSFFDKVLANGSEQQGEFFLKKDDPKNPLSIFRVPITNEIVKIAEQILEGHQNLSDHQKVIMFMNFMKDFDVGIGSNAYPETTIKERLGACGTFTNVLLALSATQGIEGRYVNLMNFPKGYGHTVAELKVNGKWSIYDPTYGVYYTDTPDNKVNPNVLSFWELRNGKGRDKNVVRIFMNNRRFEEQNQWATSAFIGPEIYEKANPAGPIGPDKVFKYPLFLDTRSKSVLTKKDLGIENQGSNYIGAASVNNIQEWTLTSLVPGNQYQFIIVPDWIGGELLGEEDNFRATARIVSGGEVTSGDSLTLSINQKPYQPWIIKFKAKKDKVNLLIEHPYRGPKFHYLNIKGYELKSISVPVNFRDIESHWAREDILELSRKSIVNGITNESFGPNLSITKAQFVSLLVRVLGINDVSNKKSYLKDINGQEWFAPEVRMALSKGLVKGDSAGYFYPNKPITRQEMAVMINNAVNYKEQDIAKKDGDIKTFKDSNSVASWAQESVERVVGLGIMQGVSNNIFAPLKNVTRAETSVVVNRFIEKFN